MSVKARVDRVMVETRSYQTGRVVIEGSWVKRVNRCIVSVYSITWFEMGQFATLHTVQECFKNALVTFKTNQKKTKQFLFYMVQAYVNSKFLQTFCDLTWKQN